jgi:hypothetical protein
MEELKNRFLYQTQLLPDFDFLFLVVLIKTVIIETLADFKEN